MVQEACSKAVCPRAFDGSTVPAPPRGPGQSRLFGRSWVRDLPNFRTAELVNVLGRLLGSLVLLIVLAGCARESAEEFLLKNAVRKYNSALIEAYRMADPGVITDLAGEAEVRKVDVLITTLQMQKKVLRASLERIRFVGIVRLGEERAEVKTSEDWSYEHVDRKSRQRVGPARGIHYELTYSMERRGGRWLVAGLRHDRVRPIPLGLARTLARPGFFRTRAPILPDVGLLGLLAVVSGGVATIWLRGRRGGLGWRWTLLGAYASLLVAGGAWIVQSVFVGNPGVRETLPPVFGSLAGVLAALQPWILAFAVASGTALLYRAFRGPGRSLPGVSSPLGIIGLTSWISVLVSGIVQYWVLFVA